MQVSRLLSPLAHVLRRKNTLSAAFAAAMLCVGAGVGHAQGTSMVILHAPVSTFGSGGNAGLIQVAEQTAGSIVSSPNQIKLTISGGNTTAGPFTTGSTTTGITPTYSGGIATFDLSTLPLYAYPSASTYTLTFTDTGSSSSPTVSTTISVSTVTNLYIVTSNADTAGTTCTNLNTSTSTPGTLDTGCTFRSAVNLVAALPYSAATTATIAFSFSSPQIITLTSTLAATASNWYVGLTIAGPGVNNLTISGGNTGTNGFEILKEHSGGPWGPLNMSGLTLANGYVSGDAAALYLYSTVNLWNVYFYNNKSTTSGGAVYWVSTASTAWVGTFNYCVFDSNIDSSNGGAIADGATNGSIVINNSLFYDNTSAANGGAIAFSGTVGAASTVAVTISNTSFIGNTGTGATSLGGALSLAFNSTQAAPVTATLNNDTFYGNSTTGTYGGAIYVNGNTTVTANETTLNMTDTTIVGNTNSLAAGKGGGFYAASGAAVVINNSLIEGNQTPGGTATNPDGFYTTANVHTINTSVANFTPTPPSTYAYPGLAGLDLSDPGSYGGPQLSIYTAGAYYASSTYNPSASTLLAVPTLVPLPGTSATPSPVLKVGSGSNQGSTATDARSVPRPTSGSTNVDVGAVQSNPALVFTAEATPSNTTVDTTFSPSPAVSYTDDGYVLTNTHSPLTFTLALTPGTLSGTLTYSPASTTVATFTSVSPTAAETGATLTATAGGGTGALTTNSAMFNVILNPTAVVLQVSPNTPVASGTAVTLTATLSPYTFAGQTTTGETVYFLSNGSVFAATTLSSTGVATVTTTDLPAGSDSLTAMYVGDTVLAPSTSPAVVETVGGSETVPTSIAASAPVTVTLTFASNFTLGSTAAGGGPSPGVIAMGASSNPFTVTGGTCTAGTSYGPSTGNPSCTVTVAYTPSSSAGGGLITGVVQVYDTSQILQGSTTVVVARYR